MPFIKIQKLVRNEDGSVRSGSAAIMDTVYDKDGKYHSRQVVRERLGKIISLDESKRKGVFMSPTRGMIAYDADKDEFSPAGTEPQPASSGSFQMIFGEGYLMIEILRKYGTLNLLRDAFPDERAYLKVMNYIFSMDLDPETAAERSFVPLIFPDSGFDVSALGTHAAKSSFFSAAAPEGENGFSVYSDVYAYKGPHIMLRFSSAGDSCPVWCDAVTDPGAPDINKDTEGIAFLSQDYFTESLLTRYGQGSKFAFAARMPARKGLPFKDLCQKALKHAGEKEYIFQTEYGKYFGIRKKTEIFGQKVYAYIYSAAGGFEMPSAGFFILISNKSLNVKDLLCSYISLTETESALRCDGSYAQNSEELCGRTIMEIASSIADETFGCVGLSDLDPDNVYCLAQSVTCRREGNELIIGECGPLARKIFDQLEIELPERLDIEEYRKSVMNP